MNEKTPTQDQLTARKKWVQALRSGDYTQAYSQLRDGDSFCCLGVACDVFKENVSGHWDKNLFRFGAPSDWTRSALQGLPLSVSNFLGIETGELDVGLISEEMESAIRTWCTDNSKSDSNDNMTIAWVNDQGASFTEIAGWVEEFMIEPHA